MDVSSQVSQCGKAIKEDLKLREPNARLIRWRNIIAFWLLGLCNNYGYVVMLSAAHDILESRFGKDTSSKTIPVNNTTIAISTSRECNPVSTGAILLADILPSLMIKLTAPFLPFYGHVRIAICVIFSLGSFVAVSFASSQWVTILGVVLTSISSGLGEATMISHSHKYGTEGITAWSSGTGGAGIIGAFSYAGLTIVMSTEDALLVMLIVPVAQAAAFWLIMVEPHHVNVAKYALESQEEIIKAPPKSLCEKMTLVPKLIKYIMPLGLVYLFEYFINQGLYELIQFDGIWLSKKDQYRWLQVDYQIGVFVSRSSAGFFTFRKIWLMSVFQFINVVIFTTEALYFYIPSIWVIFGLVLWEGLLGGGAYVNTFYRMSGDIPSSDLKASLGIVSMSDSLGIAMSAWIAMLAHPAICDLPKPIR